MKPLKVYEFDPQIYPVKLWIIRWTSPKNIDREFENLNGNPLNYGDHSQAICFSYNQVIVRKKTEKYGFLISIKDEDWLNTSQIAHEATHIARFIWEYLGEVNTGVEADAYLVGWIARCIESFKNEKI